MTIRKQLTGGLAAGCLISFISSPTIAAESGFSTYGLGGAAFGAGASPPPGTYLSYVGGYYSGDIRGNIQFGGVVFNAGMSVDFTQAAANVLYVPTRKLLGGNLGVGVTVPVGHVDLEAGLAVGPLVARDETEGGGVGDITGRVQLGWQHGSFAHLIYLQGVAATGRYDVGFNPNIGLNRPGVDTGWSFTWTHTPTKLQFNGSLGVTFNFENDATQYSSGDEFHFEWAVGYEVRQGFMIGMVGYDYRQLTGDSGSGAALGAFKGKVDAIGPGLSYTTLVGSTPLVLNARYYKEFNAEHRFEGSSTFLSATMRF